MRYSRAGMGLLEVVIALSLLTILLYGTLSMFSTLRRAERGVASDSTLISVDHSLRLILSMQGSCAQSGLIGLTIPPNNPSSVPITLHVPGGTGPGPVFLEENRPYDTRMVSSLRITAMANVGTLGGNAVYFSTLSLQMDPIGKALTFRSPQRRFYLMLILDSSNTVIACYAQVP
ncbi:MAG: hypothetical protein R3B54_04490 [Bdellovibrionota bacterium]